jgi:glycosyltransferase involved in cell wall biosynthesis
LTLEKEGKKVLMTRPAKISVVIPCYNAGKYIVAAIASVLEQGWPSMEIIVVDDGSSDGSAELVRRTFPGVKLIQQVNQGVAAARNHGIMQAQGDWIAFLDADDIWLPNKLHAQWRLLNDTPDARMSCTAWMVWGSTDANPSLRYLAESLSQSGDVERWSGPSGWIYPQLLLDCEVWTSTVLVHRSVFLEVGLFDATLPIGEDYDLWLRASQVTQILRVPCPYALYRMHPANITRSVPEINHRNLVIGRALTRWGYRSPDGKSARKADVDRALAKSWCDFGGAHLEVGNMTNARRGGLMALRSDWRLASGWKVLIKAVAGSLASRQTD